MARRLPASGQVSLEAYKAVAGPYRYTHDGNGNPLMIASPAGTTTFTWDGSNRLRRVEVGDEWEEHDYGAGGQRRAIMTPAAGILGGAATYIKWRMRSEW